MDFVSFLLGFSFTAQVFCVVVLIRNYAVHEFRCKVLHESRYDHDKNIFVPYALMPTYNHMVLEWWKPLKKYLAEAEAEMKKRYAADSTKTS